jgi:hypothetical protein
MVSPIIQIQEREGKKSSEEKDEERNTQNAEKNKANS